jgi:hypothetical protein
VHYFLGIEVKKSSDGLVLSQGKYAEDVIKWAGMNHSKSVSTPLSTVDKLSATKERNLGLKILQGIEALLGIYNI